MKEQISNLLHEYQALNHFDFPASVAFWNKIPHNTKQFKTALLEIIDEAILLRSQSIIHFLLALANHDGLDMDYAVQISALSKATWHNEHEDLVSSMGDLRNEQFVDILFQIAIHPEIYRKYDDEMESTLRKCIHALKVIGGAKAEAAILTLAQTGNENVHFVLDMYK